MDRGRWGLGLNDRDHLVVGGCDVVSLAELYGTPLHVVDERRVRLNYRRFLNAFTRFYPDTGVFYSYKTNCVPGVLKIIHEEGGGAEVTSPFESWLASRLDVPTRHVVYNGVNKAPEELRRAIQDGVGLINVDSLAELDQLRRACADLQRRVDVGIRISPRLGWNAQFGLQADRDRIVDLFREFHDARTLNLCGLHAHIGTGLQHPRIYRRLVEAVCVLMRELKRRLDLDIRYLDLGGGFGVPTVRTLSTRERALYLLLNVPPRAPRSAEHASIEAFGRVIASTLKRQCARWELREPRLLLEPGRAITSDAQMLVLQVKTIKRRRNGTAFALTDGGMQNIAFPLSYEYHHCFVANRGGARPTERYVVTGPLCSPEDILYRNWTLPALEEGDTLAVMDAGAYFTSFANNFSYPRPAVVLVADGGHRLVRDRETFEHLTALDKM